MFIISIQFDRIHIEVFKKNPNFFIKLIYSTFETFFVEFSSLRIFNWY
jgi:hypothetical protein